MDSIENVASMTGQNINWSWLEIPKENKKQLEDLYVRFCLFAVALRLNAGHGLLILEVS